MIPHFSINETTAEKLRRQKKLVGVEAAGHRTAFFGMNAEEDRARFWRREGGAFTAPYLVHIASTTHGPSILYTTEPGKISAENSVAADSISGPVTIRTKAV